mmetsp:Transcript_8456/g.23872  ORF Transcript_8456/g.23872 Transcript_8456/m.23872 type:complete len:206 (+) Transcript_8456:395-1012(+)
MYSGLLYGLGLCAIENCAIPLTKLAPTHELRPLTLLPTALSASSDGSLARRPRWLSTALRVHFLYAPLRHSGPLTPSPAILQRCRSAVIQTFDGWRSQWTRPDAWIAATPALMCVNQRRASFLVTAIEPSCRNCLSTPSSAKGSHSVMRQALAKSLWRQQSMRRTTTGEAHESFFKILASRLSTRRCFERSCLLRPSRESSLIAA